MIGTTTSSSNVMVGFQVRRVGLGLGVFLQIEVELILQLFLQQEVHDASGPGDKIVTITVMVIQLFELSL